MATAQDRTTKYIAIVRGRIESVGHATNAELLDYLRLSFPDISATTVHRITARMLERGEVQLAPSGPGNAMCFDVNKAAHDHFMCQKCGILRDMHIANIVRPLIEQEIGDGCSISGSLTVSGLCKKCQKEAK